MSYVLFRLIIAQYIYIWADLIRWHAVISFVVALPALAVLMQCRWAVWADRIRKEAVKDTVNE